jgi:dTDP-4-amino-4,6-dideoxygalactose transaminase
LIPHARPTLTDADAEAVARVVRSGFIAQGAEVEAFEAALATRFGVRSAAAVTSGTVALELAMRALDVGADDEVVIPSYACDALYHAVVRAGATPVLADADPETLSIAADDAKRRLTGRTRCLIVPHAFGLAVDLRPVLAFGLPVVEDCAQTVGAIVNGAPVGGAGHLAVGSFYATKLLTSGEGGVVAGAPELVARVRDARDYDEREDLAPRFNYKMTDMQAALGRSQLARLDDFVARRRAIAARYRRALAGARCRVPDEAGSRHVYHRFVVAVDRSLPPVIERLRQAGVTARRPVFRPIHRGLGRGGYPEAERCWRDRLSLPCFPSLTDAEVDTVAAALRAALEAA